MTADQAHKRDTTAASGGIDFTILLRTMTTLALTWVTPITVGAQQGTTTTVSVVLDSVTVIDVEQGKLIAGQRVVITGNRIAAVGSTGVIQIPASARVVNASRKYLIPGLWDLHVHALGDVPYRFYIANGVTGFRSGDVGSIFSSNLSLDSLVWWRDAILAGREVGPPRQIFAMRLPLSVLQNTAAMDSLKARGLNALKIYHYDVDQVMAARRTGLQFGGHLDDESALVASDRGHTIIDHWPEDLNERCAGDDVGLCQEVADRFRKNNTWWVPTMVRVMPIAGAVSDPIIARLAEIADTVQRGAKLPASNWLRSAMDLVYTQASQRLLSFSQRVGMPILAGTDQDPMSPIGSTDYSGRLPGLSLHAELAIYVAEGLTPLAALQTATLNPAKMLHGTDSLGTVASGKLADLVLLDANPLADITNTTTIRAVIANGRYFDRSELDRLVAEAQGRP